MYKIARGDEDPVPIRTDLAKESLSARGPGKSIRRRRPVLLPEDIDQAINATRKELDKRDIESADPEKAGSRIFGKRALDILIAGIALVTLSVPLLIIVCAIRLDSAGPALFVQWRHGKGGKPFRVLKFRTLSVADHDPSGVQQVVGGDKRITRLGRFLRKSNLDELPQLINIVRGEMSLVGPRPHPIGMLAGGRPYEELVPAYHDRHAVAPGLTGLAQVMGLRGETRDPGLARERIACDLAYVRNASVALDLRIIAQTVINECRGGTGS